MHPTLIVFSFLGIFSDSTFALDVRTYPVSTTCSGLSQLMTVPYQDNCFAVGGTGTCSSAKLIADTDDLRLTIWTAGRHIECGTAVGHGIRGACLTNGARDIAGLDVGHNFGGDTSANDAQRVLNKENDHGFRDVIIKSYAYEDEDNVMYEMSAKSEHVSEFLRLETEQEKINFLLKFADTRTPMGKPASDPTEL